MDRLGTLFRMDGEVGRAFYAAVGIIGFLLKHLADRLVAEFLFGRTWEMFSYWHSPFRPAVPFSVLGDARFAVTMLAIALPFIWVGLAMTVKRLRSIGRPAWLAFLFFVPFVNLLFFLLLCVLPPATVSGRPVPEPEKPVLQRLDSQTPAGQCRSWGRFCSLVSVTAGLAGDYDCSFLRMEPVCWSALLH